VDLQADLQLANTVLPGERAPSHRPIVENGGVGIGSAAGDVATLSPERYE
jgi:hypothetical protein